MKFRFVLNKGITIPIFKNKLGVNKSYFIFNSSSLVSDISLIIIQDLVKIV